MEATIESSLKKSVVVMWTKFLQFFQTTKMELFTKIFDGWKPSDTALKSHRNVPRNVIVVTAVISKTLEFCKRKC